MAKLHKERTPMEAIRFDRVTRSITDATSRRAAFGALIVGALSLMQTPDGDAKGKKKKKKKRKKNKAVVPPAPPPSGQCPSQFICGPVCCSNEFPVCCDDVEFASGKSCWRASNHCCPAEYGGQACEGSHECCPPLKGETLGTCANTGLGHKCCPLNSGGYCYHDEDCCPPALTNSSNRGCVASGRQCCNTDTDCGIGRRCAPYGYCELRL